MKHKYLVPALGIITISILLFLSSCKKINEASTVGGDLIPAVDNITTFDTTLEVETYNGLFTLAPPDYDSIRVRGNDIHFLGNITNDPIFGSSAATIFTQLKPANFRFSFPFSKPDSLVAFDSVMLVLTYVNTFGDTTIPQTVNVYEIDPAADFRFDTSYLVRENHVNYTGLLGSATYTPQNLDDSIRLFKDSASHQLRIRLDDAFGQRLLAYDSSSSGTNNAYYSDSTFNLRFKGFAIVPGGSGNGLIGINLLSSKLSIYYKYRHGTLDTISTDFVFTNRSATANYIQRDYSGSQLANHLDPALPQDLVYVQAQPGSFVKVRIPGLSGLSNKVIHRAELIAEQAYSDPLDNILIPPTYLYLDAFDSVKNLYRAIPFDMTIPDQTTGSIVSTNPSFGFAGKPALDGANTVREWKFNISRYVQNVVMGKEPAYTLRLHAPYIVSNTFGAGGVDYRYASYVDPTMAAGRVRLHGGDATSANPKRMRLRIVYSKI